MALQDRSIRVLAGSGGQSIQPRERQTGRGRARERIMGEKEGEKAQETDGVQSVWRERLVKREMGDYEE